ncbi:MAG: hypothetical protein NTW74_25285, partial [Acidobacteria bacterium]|nr:hypothetical protein [Acidobacteriota bacterium]
MKSVIPIFILLPLGLFSQEVDFERDVQPILKKSCFGCHGAGQQLGGLRLDAKATTFTGGVSGPSVKPNAALESPLYLRVAGMGDQARMPMGGKPLPAEQIAVLKRWIDTGAKWPDEVGAKVV